MVWLYPSFLWALLALLIPVAIHLFNFRRYKKLIFSNVRLLRKIDRQTKSGNKLKKYLILASRLLAILFLVFAFAQPILLRKGQSLDNGKKFISIILDNSYSMNLNGNEGQLFEAAKNRARAIVNAAGAGDEFNIISADMNASLLHFHGKQATLESIDKLKISSGAHPLNDLLAVQNRTLKEKNGNKLAFCISDFQSSTHKIINNPVDTSIFQTWIKLPGAEHDNFSVDTCFLESPILQTGQTITLTAQVSNYTEKEVEGLTLELEIDGKPKGIANFNIPPYGKSRQSLSFTLENGGNHQCALKLPGDNIPNDDELYFALRINQSYKVDVISESGERYADAVFSDNPGFIYKKELAGSINYTALKTNDLIVLQGISNYPSGLISELKKLVQNGSTVFVFPNISENQGLAALCNNFNISVETDLYTENLKVGSLDLEHPVYKNIFEKTPKNPDLPGVSKYLSFRAQGGNTLMRLANGKPFIQDMSIGKGHFIICASALDKSWTNLQSHALFLPTLLKSAMMGSYKTTLYYQCGETKPIYTGLPYTNESGISLKGPKTAYVPEVINMDGEMILNTNGEIETAGHYDLLDKKSDTALASISFNINRNESDTRTLTEQAFNDVTKNFKVETFEGSSEKLSAEFTKSQKGISLWKWCIIFVLFFLLIEILLIRFFRNNAKLSA
ncbi:MAG: vWA domain-containing protein [Chitinophagaceae bacterium]